MVLTGWTAFGFMLGFIVCFMILYFCIISVVIKEFEKKKVIETDKKETMADVYSTRFTLEQIRQFDRME